MITSLAFLNGSNGSLDFCTISSALGALSNSDKQLASVWLASPNSRWTPLSRL